MSLQRVVRVLRSSFLFLLAFITLVGTLPTPTVRAQDLERKVKSRVSPTYPDIARKMGLTGTVKLQIVVASNGTVKETKVIGGHPILVNAAVDAVKKWKFEAASEESTGTVEFKFDPGN